MLFHLGAGICSHSSKADIGSILSEVDLVIVDLDQCVYPAITKVALYKIVIFRLLRECRILSFLRLLGWAIPLMLLWTTRNFVSTMNNEALIRLFGRAVRGLPPRYLEQAAQSIPNGSYPGAKRALEILSRNSKVGLISQALDIVLKEYDRQFAGVFDFWEGNSLSQLWPMKTAGFIFSAEQKSVILKEKIAQSQAKRVLVIGHDRDDTAMMAVAKEKGGIVIGFRPDYTARPFCDITVDGPDWEPLADMLEEMV